MLLRTAATSLVPTVLTSATAAESATIGGLGFSKGTRGYNVLAEVSVGSTAAAREPALRRLDAHRRGEHHAIRVPGCGMTQIVDHGRRNVQLPPSQPLF